MDNVKAPASSWLRLTHLVPLAGPEPDEQSLIEIERDRQFSFEVRLAWATGIFEGEGCIATDSEGPGSTLRVSNTDPSILFRVQDLLGGKVYGPYSTPHKPVYQWRIENQKAICQAMFLMWPHLSCRRKEKAKELGIAPLWERAMGER